MNLWEDFSNYASSSVVAILFGLTAIRDEIQFPYPYTVPIKFRPADIALVLNLW